MSYGLCCLVSDIPENLEALDTHGMLFQNRNVADLTAKLEFLLDSPTVVRRYAAGAVSRVQLHYSWDNIADEFEQYYLELLQGTQKIPVPRETVGIK